MHILALDTSSLTGSMAVLFQNPDGSFKCLAEESWNKQSSHSEVITIAYSSLLEQTNIQPTKFSALAIGCGPGSFTGIRVGINFARSLAYSHNLGIYAFDSLRLLAEPARPQELPVLCLVNAYKNLTYCATYQWKDNQLLQDLSPRVMAPANLQLTTPHLCLGTGYSAYLSLWTSAQKNNMIRNQTLVDEPQARHFSSLLASQLTLCKKISWNELKALYLRESEAEEKLGMGLLKPIPKL